MSSEDLPLAEFGFPGPLRDQLVAAILAGDKTTTTGLVADYEIWERAAAASWSAGGRG
jgi:uncharacterized protein YhfF